MIKRHWASIKPYQPLLTTASLSSNSWTANRGHPKSHGWCHASMSWRLWRRMNAAGWRTHVSTPSGWCQGEMPTTWILPHCWVVTTNIRPQCYNSRPVTGNPMLPDGASFISHRFLIAKDIKRSPFWTLNDQSSFCWDVQVTISWIMLTHNRWSMVMHRWVPELCGRLQVRVRINWPSYDSPSNSSSLSEVILKVFTKYMLLAIYLNVCFFSPNCLRWFVTRGRSNWLTPQPH